METIITIIGILLAALGYNYVKRKSAESLLENNDTKEKVNSIDGQISKNEGTLDSEAQKRQELLDKVKEAVKDNEDLSKFFNDHFPSGK